MKKARFVGYALTLTSFIPWTVQAELGLLKLLRGDEAPVKKEYQRVAIVGSGVVKDASGKVERLCGVDCWEPLRAGAELAPGDVIRNENGRLIVQMTASESFIKVTPGTILRLAPFDNSWDRAVLTGREEESGFVVRSCRGDAAYRTSEGEWQRVLVNAVLPDTAVVRTERGTIVDLYSTAMHRSIRVEGQRQLELAQMFDKPLKAESSLARVTR